MIRFIIIILGLFLLFKKIYFVIKKSIENYRDTGKKHFFNVQTAKTKKEREIGLMYVDKLSIDSGMLFEYPNNTYAKMWMKNTKIPLDVIFINSDARVVDFHKNMKPLSKKEYTSGSLCKYALEINGGLIDKMNIKKGDLIGTSLVQNLITKFKPVVKKKTLKSKDKSNKDKSNKDKSKKDKSKKDKSNNDKSKKDKSNNDKSNNDKSKKDKSNNDKSKKDKSNNDKSKKDKSKKDKSKKDK